MPGRCGRPDPWCHSSRTTPNRYTREDSILPHLDAWIAGLVTPGALAAGQDDLAQGGRAASLLAAISDLDHKIASLAAAVESEAEIAALTDQLSKRSAERPAFRHNCGRRIPPSGSPWRRWIRPSPI
jgi:hypothetical protein